MKKKTLRLIMCLVFVCAFSVCAVASSTVYDITAQIDESLKVKLDGKDFFAKEANGSELRPITYNGRTYLPVRAIAEAVGKPVDYEATNNTVILGERSEKVTDLSDMLIGMYYSVVQTTDKELLTQNGKTYKSGFVVRTEKNYNSFYIALSTKSKYTKVGLTINSTDDNRKIKIVRREDNVVLAEISTKKGEVTTEVDLKNADSIDIKFENISDDKAAWNKLLITDVYFK